MGKIATKNELQKRGIGIPDMLCETCDFEEENANHLFAKCVTARSIWWNIFSWLKIPWQTNLDSLQEILDLIQNSPGAKTWKRHVHMIAIATVWRIWNVRNRRIFEGEGISVQKAVDLIKEDSFIWKLRSPPSLLRSPPSLLRSPPSLLRSPPQKPYVYLKNVCI
ncbi:uncharacterized protein LOC110942941 [Helianthus annuus]|uniref:uncharacterized protein LOC110942941 n=1 Tax=Helianthus annuus TaxID=4232 RepID=UPI000B909BA3|nr:uncharacterized protein LOC110942941 [Helianthus annuus]